MLREHTSQEHLSVSFSKHYGTHVPTVHFLNLTPIYYLLLTIYNLQFTIYYLLSTIYYLLFTIYYLLFTIYYLLFTIEYLLFTIYYLLFTIYNLLFTIYYLQTYIISYLNPDGTLTPPSLNSCYLLHLFGPSMVVLVIFR